MKQIIFPDNVNDQIGGKAQALASLQNTSLPIPAWFVVAPSSFWLSLSSIQALIFATTEEEIQAAISELQPPENLCREIAGALQILCPNGESVAVRSSAIDEDDAEFSFAGQLESFLFAPPNEVIERIIDVWRSGFSERILTYRRENNLSFLPKAPAVMIQRMIKADAAGVAFGANAITGQRNIAIVSAVQGIGVALVSGECDADTFHVNREAEIVARKLVGNSPVLSDDQIKEIAKLVRACNQHFNRPQDIEWAIENGQIWLLQSRPITTLKNLADPDGALNLWDNSNIAESYGGVTTPLTFSFARRAYEEVYRQFCRLMLVPEATIQQHDQTFKHMLGLIHGRVFYNLLNWYRVLAMLPGFKINRRFMEQMMGVKEGLPECLLAEIEGSGKGEKLRDSLNLLITIGGLIKNQFILPKTIAAFYARLNDALQDANPALNEMRADELSAYYRRIEAQLLKRWDAPLINDFFAMIFYGALRSLVEKWCGNKGGNLQNNLLCGEGDIISAEPARRIQEMAEGLKNTPEFVALLCQGSIENINSHLEEFSIFNSQLATYLQKFGDRCLDELKLESATLNDDPLMLFRSIGHLAKRMDSDEDPVATAPGTVLRAVATGFPPLPNSSRLTAEQQLKTIFSAHPIRRVIFNWVLRNARARVRDRENLRFERTRLFGRARRLFIEIGKRFYADNLLNEPCDIFYLEVEEILGFIAGAATTTNLKALVAVRKTEFEQHRQANAPADRFETRGIIHQGNQFQSIKTASVSTIGDTRQGLGCCPGIVRGKVRVITDPRNTVIQPSEILVAERTDPGWIMLFPAAAAVLVERGSLLSHAAIVAREMGIPAIVSIAGITQWLRDGDEVEMDGSSGIVRKVAATGTVPRAVASVTCA